MYVDVFLFLQSHEENSTQQPGLHGSGRHVASSRDANTPYAIVYVPAAAVLNKLHKAARKEERGQVRAATVERKKLATQKSVEDGAMYVLLFANFNPQL